MRRKKTITLASKPTYQGYSHAFKMAIIERIENGQLSINQAAREYDCSRSAVQKWVRKYANLERKLRDLKGKSPQQEIAELKKKLKQEQRKNQVWEAAMDIVEEMYDIDVKKKLLNKYQRNVLRNLYKESE